MKYIDWNAAKNEILRIERGVTFEGAMDSIIEGFLLDVVEHSNQDQYANQKIFVIQIEEYVYLVPFVEDEKKIFLKTIIPSRKATKHYLINNKKTKK